MRGKMDGQCQDRTQRWHWERGLERKILQLCTVMDQVNLCLDHLEEKNDHLHSQLQDLLESNRQARRDFQLQSHQQQANSPDKGQAGM
ncbi:hypothetical protein GDO86_015162 [Hymenochirus boettgeri]|uniref:Uncharacterized protein n=1 Tax=Hymenochirus boettgeri TaxID=247094 RepID=A0A8T2K037_9PIPI|nr:hypothetical protein GDO86_015162 [Hymenochirus boettgeri]